MLTSAVCVFAVRGQVLLQLNEPAAGEQLRCDRSPRLSSKLTALVSPPASQLLNTTISSIAINVNNVLTRAYQACYGQVAGSTDEDELMLVTAPLSATTEIEALYAAQIIDVESALPAALHSLGCSANEISEALKRRLEKESQRGDAEGNALLAESELKAAQSAKTTEEIEAVRAGIEKTKAETAAIPATTAAATALADANAYKAREDAKKPAPAPAPKPSAGSGGDSR